MNKMDHHQVCWADTQYNQVVNRVTDSFKPRSQVSPLRLSFIPISATEKLNLYDVRTLDILRGVSCADPALSVVAVRSLSRRGCAVGTRGRLY